MNLVELNDVTIANNLVHYSLSIQQYERLGLVMDNQESQLLLDLLSGRIFPSSGSFQLNAELMFKRNTDGMYDDLTVKTYLKLFFELAKTRIDLKQVMEIFHLDSEMKTKINNLSVDQKERLHLLRIYLFQPKVLLLESPLRKLTSSGARLYLELVDYLRTKGITIVVIASSLNELQQLSTVCYRINSNRLEKIESSATKQNLKIVSRRNDQIIYFDVSEIDFIESINGVTNLSVAGKYYPVNFTLNEMTAKLVSEDFFRCHRSYIVNLKMVLSIENYSKNSYTIILKNQSRTELPLSRTKVTEIKQLLGTIQR
jgi:Response regulator of the LytR/AlgR family